MTTPIKKNLLDYFSIQTKKSESNENGETPKKQKCNVNERKGRVIVESSSDSLGEIEEVNIFSSQNNSNECLKSQDDFKAINEPIISQSENKYENLSMLFSDKENNIENPEIKNSFCSKMKNFDVREIKNDYNNKKVSSIIADFMNVDTTEFDILETAISSIEPEVKTHKEKNEERYHFLLDIRDNNLKRIGEEGYDATKLYIPEKYYSKFTPFEKQFWDIKKEYFDTVIFFKKGKFYELYEQDAEIASRLFDLKVTERVNMKMAGFPECSYEVWASKFISHGYKVGRVEQAENAIGKKLREVNAKKDKIILRELTEVITQGTVYNSEFLYNNYAQYLSVIVQSQECRCEDKSNLNNHYYHFSVILYDASINKIIVMTFGDSIDLNRIKTLFVQNIIKEIITEVDIKLPENISKVKPIKENIVTSKKFDFKNDDEFLCYKYLFNYLKLLCRESSLNSATITYSSDTESHVMCLDGSTLQNLDIFVNNFDKTENFTLFKTINYCCTPFGQRLLRKWIVSPLIKIDKIIERQILSEVFMTENDNLLNALISSLTNLGDFERSNGKLCNSQSNFKDLKKFIECLKKAEIIFSILLDYFNLVNFDFIVEKFKMSKSEKFIFENQKISSKKFREKISEIIFNFEKTYKVLENEIIPGNENDELFNLNKNNQLIISKLNDFLKNLERSLKVNLCYKSVGKEIYQIEAPSNVKMPSDFFTVSSTKTTVRYYSKDLKVLVNELIECEERIFQSQNSIIRRAIDFFKNYSDDLNQIIFYLSTIDCFISFSRFNKAIKGKRPIFYDLNDTSDQKLVIKNFSNPVYPDYIKNDYKPDNTVTLVTGPNMGGKSTFLRSISLNIILAQMGMYVPADYMCIPVFDNLYTRIGASDSLAKGESTFMMELNETSKILNNCTNKSFIIMDELGRGTSTKDGEAIAKAVLDYVKNIKSYTLFATHYHNLVKNSINNDNVYPEFAFEKDDIVFLYKIKHGICNNSHGLYVAKLAGVPESVINKAFEIREKILNNEKN